MWVVYSFEHQKNMYYYYLGGVILSLEMASDATLNLTQSHLWPEFSNFPWQCPPPLIHMLYLCNSLSPLSPLLLNDYIFQCDPIFFPISLSEEMELVHTHHSLISLPFGLSWEAITFWPDQVLYSHPLKTLVWVQYWIWRVSFTLKFTLKLPWAADFYQISAIQ